MAAAGLWAAMAAMVAEERRQVAREAARSRLTAPDGGRGHEAVVVRWLTRRSRIPRRLRAAAVALGAPWLVGLAAPSSPAQTGQPAQPGKPGAPRGPKPEWPCRPRFPEPAGAGNPTERFPDSPALAPKAARCTRGAAPPATGSLSRDARHRAVAEWRRRRAGRLLPLDRADAAPETPRRAAARHAGIQPPQIDALIAYISSYGGPAAPTADPARATSHAGFTRSR